MTYGTVKTNHDARKNKYVTALMKFYIHMNRTKSKNAINNTTASGSIGGKNHFNTNNTKYTSGVHFRAVVVLYVRISTHWLKRRAKGHKKESACLPQGSEPCTEWLFLRWAFVKDCWVYSLQGQWRRIVFILTRERQGLYWNNLTPKHLSPIFQPSFFFYLQISLSQSSSQAQSGNPQLATF